MKHYRVPPPVPTDFRESPQLVVVYGGANYRKGLTPEAQGTQPGAWIVAAQRGAGHLGARKSFGFAPKRGCAFHHQSPRLISPLSLPRGYRVLFVVRRGR